MKKLPYIKPSKTYYGKFEVVASPDCIIPCHNLATAATIIKKIKEEKNERKFKSNAW